MNRNKHFLRDLLCPVRVGQRSSYSITNKRKQLFQKAIISDLIALLRLRSPFPQKERETLEKELAGKYEKEIAELKASYEARLQDQENMLMEQVRVKLRDKLLALSRRGEQLASLQEEVD